MQRMRLADVTAESYPFPEDTESATRSWHHPDDLCAAKAVLAMEQACKAHDVAWEGSAQVVFRLALPPLGPSGDFLMT